MPTGKKLPPGPLTTAVATILQAIAIEKNISQAEIGRRHIGTSKFLSQSQVSRFFALTKGIDVDQLNGLCETLGVSVIEVIEQAEGGNITRLRPRVSGPSEDGLRGVAREAETEPTDEQ